jgi:predicted nucleic acid-binding protein
MTTVLDASAVVKFVTRQVDVSDLGHFADTMVAPDLMLSEVGSGLRRAARAGLIASALAPSLLLEALEMPVATESSRELIERAFELRHNVTVADGCYVALAERLGCGILTSDVRLVRAPGVSVPFTLV